MTIEALTSTWQRLNVATEAMAALGATLKLRISGGKPGAEIAELLDQVLDCLGPQLLNDISPAQEQATLGFIQSFFRQALDLLEKPERPAGWTYEDPMILQAMGQASRSVVDVITELGRRRPSLGAALNADGRFLDVGTGVGWLAIEAARRWPDLHITGIDPFAPALELARANLAKEGLVGRIEFEQQSVEQLNQRDRYNVVWLAGPFIPRNLVKQSLGPLRQALVAGGTLVFGLFATPPDPLAQALLKLKVTRNGGYFWSVEEATGALVDCGFIEIETFAPTGPTRIVVGRRPD